MENEKVRLTTGIPALDEALEGGIPVGELTVVLAGPGPVGMRLRALRAEKLKAKEAKDAQE